MKAQRRPADRRSDYAGPQLCTIEDFPDAMTFMLERHRPSRMPFFERLAAMPRSAASDPSFLGQIHLIYQSAMHATRAAVYYLPHLDSPALRKRKLQIFVDDDGLPGGDTHHYQLTRAFRKIGAKCVLEDEEFGEPEELSATSTEKRPILLVLHGGSTHALSVPGARSRQCRSIGCERLQRPSPFISHSSSTSLISRSASHIWSRNAMPRRRSR